MEENANEENFKEEMDSDSAVIDYSDDDINDDEDYEEELFKENPLKAIWIMMKEIKDLLQSEDEDYDDTLDDKYLDEDMKYD